MADVPADGAEIQIELGDVRQKAIEKKRRPDNDRSLAVVSYGKPDRAGTAIYIHEQVLRSIEAHAASDPSIELGGALLGGVFRDSSSPEIRGESGGELPSGQPPVGAAEDGLFVEITDFIIATKAEHAHANITFTHDTWIEIETERERRGAKAQIVGWYHTHPDIGVFLSEPDIFIQKNFFREPWQVAMVLDPVRGSRGFFQAKGDYLVQAPGFYIFAERRRRKELEEYASQLETSARRLPQPMPPPPPLKGGIGTTLWLIILTLMLAAVIIGEAITGRPLFAPPPRPESSAALSMEMGDYEDAERLYAQALLLQPKDEELLRRFALALSKAQEAPEISTASQKRFVRWFLSKADEFAAQSDYDTAEKFYGVAGVSLKRIPRTDEAWTTADAEVLAAYRYLADRTRIAREKGRSEPPEEEDDKSLKMMPGLKRSWDIQTANLIRSGLKRLIKEAGPDRRRELENVLKELEKEYMLRSSPARR